MKKSNKKGFTIVELVIVIAVIAILSAVLIPTFSSIVAKANLAADKQTVRQLNVALATGEKATTYNEMADILERQGFNVKGINGQDVAAPASTGHTYFWSVEHNTIVLVKDNAIVFPENDSRFTTVEDNAAKWLKISAGNYTVTSTATTAEAAKTDIQNAIASGNSITLTTPVTFDTPVATVAVGDSVKVDLGGSTLKTIDRGDGQMAYGFNVYGELELVNANIIARGVEVRGGGIMTLGEDVNITSNGISGGAAIYVYEGGTAIVNGGTYSNNVPFVKDMEGSTAVVSKGNLIINGGTFTSIAGNYPIEIQSGTATIKNATVSGYRGGIAVVGAANVTIENCNVSTTYPTASAHAVYVGSSNATVVINGGNYEGGNGYGLCVVKGNVTVKAGTFNSTSGSFTDLR